MAISKTTAAAPATAPRRLPIELQRSKARRPRAYTPSLFPPAASHGNPKACSEATQPSAEKPAPSVTNRAGLVAIACLDGASRDSNRLIVPVSYLDSAPCEKAIPPGALSIGNPQDCHGDANRLIVPPSQTLPTVSDKPHTPRTPIESSASPGALVGIARLAAESPLAQEKRATEYFSLPVRSVLNRCDSARMPFEWTINPYRGCEFGCRYCYARYTHEFMELDGHDFARKIFVKRDAAKLLEQDLNEEAARVSSLLGQPEQIALGTATDPYQPAERDFGVIRSLLEKLADRQGLDLTITTKSDQVVRDIDVLQRIAARSSLTINISITTPRPRLARMLEPRAPRPDLRFAAVRKLREAGLHAGVFVMPILPGLTDREADLETLAHSAHQAGAEWFTGGVLWLMPAARKEFLPFLEANFPKLARGYQKWYAQSAYAPQHYREEIALRVSRVRSRYRMGHRPYFAAPRPSVGAAPHSIAPAGSRQLSLRLPAAS